MASPLEAITKLAAWQRIVLWVGVAVLLALVWYFLWYAEAIEARQAADQALSRAEADLQAMQAKLENFEEEQRKAAEMERQIRQLREELPTSAATVDNMMQTFQQQARLVGLAIDSWTPGGEEKLDFYAKLPVDVRAVGSWFEVGEFMRRVSELKKIVSVENLSLKAGSGELIDAHPELEVQFRAATYRFLSDEERTAARGDQTSRRKGKTR